MASEDVNEVFRNMVMHQLDRIEKKQDLLAERVALQREQLAVHKTKIGGIAAAVAAAGTLVTNWLMGPWMK